MKHKHYEMIVAKAANMDLVLFNKSENQDGWSVSHETCLPVFSTCDYFLCLPQHKEACLHWLNGGEVQLVSPEFSEFPCGYEEWLPSSVWMDKDYTFRIKPKKEKRWIAVDVANLSAEFCFSGDVPASGYQIIEIEVEV